MTFLQILTLAAVQGLTEFLPVSSSGHLILVPHLTGWPDQGLHFDIAFHVGTLMAVLCYFHKDIFMIARDTLTWPVKRENTFGTKLFCYLILATIPAVLFGLVYSHFFPEGLRSVPFIAANLIVFGLLMGIADRFGKSTRQLHQFTWIDAIFIGLAQAIAIIPGVSRSGITITAARFLGTNRAEAARFSMLLAIPTITGAAILATKDLLESQTAVPWNDLAMGIGFAFLFGLGAITFMMHWLKNADLKIFVGYRIIIGILLLIFLT